MAPKRSLPLQSQADQTERSAKRAKSSEAPGSRSATPADQMGKVPFEIRYPVMDLKRKLSNKERELIKNADFMESPFIAKGASKEGELDQHYTVVPNEEWSSMKKYNNFIIQGEVYKNNQFVFVRGESTPKNKAVEDPKDFWVARILQVRAKNAQHVYALVAWMYWPDEIPPPKKYSPDQVSPSKGKRIYHGTHELVASNYMEVLDVLSFAGKAEVGHWLEEDDNLPFKLFWRQTYCRETLELSALRKHCICDGHFNPGVAMEICENPSCKVWLHEQCIIDNILTNLCNVKTEENNLEAEDQKVNNGDGKSKLGNGKLKHQNDNSVSSETNGSVSKTNGKKSKFSSKVWAGKFEGKLIPASSEGPTTISITELKPGKRGTWIERIPCAKCGTLLE